MAEVNKHAKPSPPDFSLLLSRMESELLAGRNIEKHKSLLKKAEIRDALSPDQCLSWAELCQIAGMIDTALSTYDRLHEKSPGMAEAWERHLDLLLVLNKREKAASLLSRAIHHLPPDKCAIWSERCRAPARIDTDKDMISASAPFESLKRETYALNLFLSLFSGRNDVFARQWADKGNNRQGYFPVRRPMTTDDVADHLSGGKTYGIYLIDENGNVKTAVIDADLVPAFRKPGLTREKIQKAGRERTYLIHRILDISKEAGAYPLVEFSGSKGFHFWFFFEEAVPAGQAKSFIGSIAQKVAPDLEVFSLEIFPKQEKLSGKGLGNLVKLPLGIHRKTGKKSFFLGCKNRTKEAQLSFLETVKKIPVSALNRVMENREKDKLAIHPRLKKWASDIPELYTLEPLCPPIGRIIAACRDRQILTAREEKILYQTIGFLPRKKTLIHYLMSFDSEYNPHLVNYKLSRIRGTPLGCRKIHSLLDYTGDFCRFDRTSSYPHPLLHIETFQDDMIKYQGKTAENLEDALEMMKIALMQMERLLKPKGS